MKQIKIEKPVYQTVQTGVVEEIKWEASDGKVFDTESAANYHEFYHCKVNHRGANLPTYDLSIFDFQCKEDLEKYEKDYIYNGQIKKYDKDQLQFPGTYAMWEEHEDGEYDTEDDDDYGYYNHKSYLHCEPLEDYRERLLKAVQEMK